MINTTVLNVQVDEVLRAVSAESAGAVSVTTSSVDALIDTENHFRVRRDVDESAVEESETAIRRHTRTNLNFVLTTAAGSAIVTTALLSSSDTTSAIALVAGGSSRPRSSRWPA